MRTAWRAFTLVLLGTAFVSCPAHADCIDYAGYFHWIDGLHLPGNATDVAVAGDLVFVAENDSGLFVVDAARDMEVIGHLPLPGSVTSLALAGSLAYLAESGSLRVVDISDPANLRFRSSLELGCVGVVISGGYCYLACGSGLLVYDVASSEGPRYVGGLATEPAEVIAVFGSRAYLSAHRDLIVIDVADPALPRRLGTVSTSAHIDDVTASGEFAYVANHEAGFQVVDVSDPQDPRIVGTAPTPSPALSVAVSGGYAFVGDGLLGAWTAGYLWVIDVSDPQAPMIVNSFEPLAKSCHGVTVSGNRLFFAYRYPDAHDFQGGICALDITNPKAPPVVGGLDGKGVILGIAVQGTMAYATELDAGFRVIDVTDPENPAEQGSLDIYDGEGLAVRDDYAYVAAYVGDGRWGLQVIDVSDPQNPVAVGQVRSPSGADYIALSDPYVVLGAWRGMDVIDVADPEDPETVGALDVGDDITGLAASGSYAYLSDSRGVLYIVDMSDPFHPYQAAALRMPDLARGVTVSGTYAYVVTDSGLCVVDISDPPVPRIVGSVQTPEAPNGVTILDDHAYVTANYGGMFVVDVSDPENPTYIGGETRGFYYCVAAEEGYLYRGAERLEIVPLQCPAGSGVGESSVFQSVLHACPNPMAQQTWLSFSLRESSSIVATIYDVAGRTVRRLEQGTLPSGPHALFWDGCDDDGHRAAHGTYLAAIRTEGGALTTRLVTLR